MFRKDQAMLGLFYYLRNPFVGKQEYMKTARFHVCKRKTRIKFLSLLKKYAILFSLLIKHLYAPSFSFKSIHSKIWTPRKPKNPSAYMRVTMEKYFIVLFLISRKRKLSKSRLRDFDSSIFRLPFPYFRGRGWGIGWRNVTENETQFSIKKI